MYASIIGRKLLQLWNRRENSNLSPEEFFYSVFYDCFYNHEKYLQWVTNSPFVQEVRSGKTHSSEDRHKWLNNFRAKIEAKNPDASFAIGFGAEDKCATTSGQISGIELPFDKQDIYGSWIGSGLGIGIAGGLSLFIDNDDIIQILYDGWQRYRLLLNETSGMRGNQINTWNGQWLYFALDHRNYSDFPFAPIEQNKDSIEIPTISWIKLIFALARSFPDKNMNAYVYSLGQTNTTIGFIQINLPAIKREIEMYNYLFGRLDGITMRVIDEVYNTQYGFKRACQNGVIGLGEIEPKQLREYLPTPGGEPLLPKIKSDEKSIINFNIYLSWILAMLNDKNTIDAAEDLAAALLSYIKLPDRAKKTQENKVTALFKAASRKAFIEGLTEILADYPSSGEFFNTLVAGIDKMQADKFPYFLTLVKFKYTYLKSK